MSITTTTPPKARAGAKPRSMKVKGVGGFEIELQNGDEVKFFTAMRSSYTTDFAFTAKSDIADVDRLLVLETQSFRIQRAIASGVDGDGIALSWAAENEMTKKLKDLTPMISAIKTDLGISRSAREKETNDSVGGYLTQLRVRAKAFGLHRNTQVHEALTVMNDIKSLIGTFRRANGTERERLGALSAEEVLEHIEKNLIPRFDKVDADWRAGDQKTWVGTL